MIRPPRSGGVLVLVLRFSYGEFKDVAKVKGGLGVFVRESYAVPDCW